MRHQAGDVLTDNLVLVRELGRGAMGSVWVAQNRALGAEVAVKLVDKFDSPEACARFQTEARGLAQIDSPHVVRVFDYGITSLGYPFIVMELLRGEDLGARLRRAGTLDIATTAEIVRQCCIALGRAHALGAVHRDIKPANIFLCEAEGAIFIKVLDFGVAKFATEANMNMTSTGVLMGTPYYMSPEQLMDPRSIDHRADLWSVAVVAYACLTGNVPFGGETLGALSVAIHMGSYAPLQTARRDLPAALDSWLARGLAVDRERRFSSAAEMAQALALITASATQIPISGPVPTAPSVYAAVPSMPAPPHASQVPPTLNGVVAPTQGTTQGTAAPGSIAGFTQPGGGPPAPVAPAPPARRGMPGWQWALIIVLVLGVGAGAFALGTQGSDAKTAKDASGAAGSKKKKKKTKKETDEDSETDGAVTPAAPAPAPAPPAPAPSPSPAADPTPAPAPAPSPAAEPAPAPKPKPAAPKPWRRRGDTCAKHDSTKFCTPCCRQPGDVMSPYPECACTFDGEKWDREHGRSP
jgi:hypothetical protein